MKNLMLFLVMALMTAGAPQSGESLGTRYTEFSERVSVTVDHDIFIDGMDGGPIATRDFSFDLTQTADSEAAAVTVTIDRAAGSYTAHDQKQRLGTRHLTGKTFSLSLGDGGRQIGQVEGADAPVIDVGPPVDDGFSIAALLVDTLPILPQQELVVGTTWTTGRAVRSLEGWAWGNGRMTSRHRVTAVEGQGDHSVVTVVTEAEAQLGPVKDERSFTGEIKRTLSWTFDATEGRLLSMSMEQESSGSCLLPQGVVAYRQQTRIELAPLGPRPAS